MLERLRDKFLAGLFVLVLIGLVAMIVFLPPTDMNYLEKRTFELVNRERVAAGLPAMQWDERLAEVARSHSREMAETDYFGHLDENGDYADGRLRRAGITGFALSGENIHLGYGGNADRLVQIAVSNWKNSASHYSTLTRTEFTRTGVGVARTGTFYYFTQVFVDKTG